MSLKLLREQLLGFRPLPMGIAVALDIESAVHVQH
jgi:hypothetical protein